MLTPAVDEFVVIGGRNAVNGERAVGRLWGGTVHLPLGRAYEGTVGESGERNRSAVHRKLVTDMREGLIELGGEVVQEGGVFVWEQA